MWEMHDAQFVLGNLINRLRTGFSALYILVASHFCGATLYLGLATFLLQLGTTSHEQCPIFAPLRLDAS